MAQLIATANQVAYSRPIPGISTNPALRQPMTPPSVLMPYSHAVRRGAAWLPGAMSAHNVGSVAPIAMVGAARISTDATSRIRLIS